jgi:nitroreductase
LVVVEKQELKNELFNYSYNQEQVKDCSHLLILCRKIDLSEKIVDELIEDIVGKS